MGIFDKVKNMFYDEEEIEEEKEVLEEEKIHVNKKIDDTIISERELFKTTKDFKFPIVFDEDDFIQSDLETFIEQGLKEKKQPQKEEIKETKPKVFTPSPIISPVYGILDKNYKKESKDYKNVNPHKLDLDTVRNKAFGTLMDDLDAMLENDNNGIFYTVDEEDDLNNTLEQSILDSIPNNLDPYTSIGEVEDDYNNNEIEHVFDAKSMNNEEQEEKRQILDDTVENDLFNLIDEIYEKMDKEEKEE